MDLDWQLDRLKDNEPTSIPDLIELIEDDNDIIDKNNIIKRLNNVNYLWEFIMIYYDNYIPEGH